MISTERRVRTTRPRVLETVAGRIEFEHGAPEEFGTPDHVAVLAQWSDTAVLSRSFATLVNEFATAGYRTVVISASTDPAPLDWNGPVPANTFVLRKPNFGYDFGSWSVALNELPAIAAADRVVLANDSMVGPFRPIDDVLKQFDEVSCDVFGLIDNRQFFRHLQSYFIGFAGGILSEPPLARFFAGVRDEKKKWDIVRRYELGLNKLFRTEGYGFTSAFRADDVVPGGENPVIEGWWRLLELGFPFVKREIVRKPDIAPGGEHVSQVVAAVYGERLQDWL